MADFNEIYDEIKEKVIHYTENSVSKYKEQAKREVKEFLDVSKDSVKLWTEQLAQNKITIMEYEYLVGGLKDIAELKILKNAGLAQQRVAMLIGFVLNTIIDVALRKIK
jgi:hypothetical protein